MRAYVHSMSMFTQLAQFSWIVDGTQAAYDVDLRREILMIDTERCDQCDSSSRRKKIHVTIANITQTHEKIERREECDKEKKEKLFFLYTTTFFICFTFFPLQLVAGSAQNL